MYATRRHGYISDADSMGLATKSGGQKKFSARFARRICPPTFKTVAPPLPVSENKRPLYWNSTSGSTLSFTSSSACDSRSAYQILSKSDNWRPSYDVITISKMATTASQIYFRFPLWRRIAIKNAKIYLHTTFRQRSSIPGRDITIFGFRKQTAAILKFQAEGASPTNHCWFQKTRVIALSCGIKISAVRCTMWSQFRNIADG